MVLIHGGAYHSGSSSPDRYGHDYLIEKNVTVVTLQYRLGAFGFLSLDDEELGIPGNGAFKDQRMAIKFVHVCLNRNLLSLIRKTFNIFYH